MKFKKVKLFKLSEQDQVGDIIKKFVWNKKEFMIIEDNFDKACGIATNPRVENDYLILDLSIDCRKIKKNKLITAAPIIKVIDSSVSKNERVVISCELFGVTICQYHTQLGLNNNLK